MTGTAATREDEPIFDAVLTPHRSLGFRGFLILMGFVTVLWLGVGLYFLSQGAWPVIGFFGLDLVILAVGFWVNYRAARAREEVKVWRHDIAVRQIAPSGRERSHSFNPFFARFSVTRKPEVGITEMALKDRGRSLPIGTFLNPDDRDSFAGAFSDALQTARRG